MLKLGLGVGEKRRQEVGSQPGEEARQGSEDRIYKGGLCQDGGQST